MSTSGMETLEGWWTLHDFRRFDYANFTQLPVHQRLGMIEEAKNLFQKWEGVNASKEGSFAFYEIAGHKADFVFLHLRPTLEEITALERSLQRLGLARYLVPSYSYVSVVELSNYVVNQGENPLQNESVRARLYPSIPDKKYFCFYPMNKKREVGANWYQEPLENRKSMMYAHGMTGRKFAGKVTQMIGGSIGLDDWEWCVTLFASDPLIFKKVVTEMRFDEVSARFAEFGDFYVGKQLSSENIITIFS